MAGDGMRWMAWVPVAGDDMTIDHKVANPWSYASRVHLVPKELGLQPDGNYSNEYGKALCGAKVPDGECVIEFLEGRALESRRAIRCKKCLKKGG